MAASRLAVIERWFLRGGVFVLPLAYAWGTYDRYVLPKLLVVRILVVGLLILFIARSALSGTLEIRRTPLDLPVLLFLSSAVLSTILAVNRNVAIFGTYARYDGLLTIATYAAVFWLSAQALSGPDDARALVRTLLFSAYVVAAIAIVQSVADSLAFGPPQPAIGTAGQKNILGIFLAMALPLAIGELASAASWSARIISINLCAVFGVALVLTLSRSAWFGAALGLVVLLAGNLRVELRRGLLGVAAILAATAVAAVIAFSVEPVAVENLRVGPVKLVLGLWGGTPVRFAIWHDSLKLIASRPLAGYGPDTFGLVYPQFQSITLGHQPLDKAHAETLQVAATQGLIGLAAYALILFTLWRAFRGGRRDITALALFGAIVAYQATLQVNFSTIAAAAPYWIVVAAALEWWGATHSVSIPRRAPRWQPLVAAPVVAGLAALLVISTLPVYLADAHLLDAVTADQEGRPASADAADAHALAPWESVYEVEVANIAFERSDWSRAAAGYTEAARLGTYDPLVYRNLALADRNLGRLPQAKQAAEKAVELDRYDPANRALLAEFVTA